ncbi:hypothetical protein PAMC26510_01905 [Caballeronia sordidicola]|uniref:Uncharacterized protein n=1 Tax=Caballeronia sordidicola TaxID=196367 RepID=A0A242N9P5_CABSO|nr:hypothetical protein PAMC26510_01905 [Caballeronia sordidicola]
MSDPITVLLDLLYLPDEPAINLALEKVEGLDELPVLDIFLKLFR